MVEHIQAKGHIINYIVMVANFKLRIRILNLEINPPQNLKLIGEGAYGKIYQINCKNKSFISKRISLQQRIIDKQLFLQKQTSIKIKSNNYQIKQVICQYSIYKICGFFQIGPKIMIQTLGFDLILYRNSIEFFMQKCSFTKKLCSEIQNKAFDYRLKFCVKLLHSLKIIHKDIKPSNILYSKNCKNYVLSDFGLSHPVKQQIGYFSKTYRQGTKSYMSDDMKKIKNVGYVNLYNNDMYALKKTLNELKLNNFTNQKIDIKNNIARCELQGQQKKQNNQFYEQLGLINTIETDNKNDYLNTLKKILIYEKNSGKKDKYNLDLLINIFGISFDLFYYYQNCEELERIKYISQLQKKLLIKQNAKDKQKIIHMNHQKRLIKILLSELDNFQEVQNNKKIFQTLYALFQIKIKCKSNKVESYQIYNKMKNSLNLLSFEQKQQYSQHSILIKICQIKLLILNQNQQSASKQFIIQKQFIQKIKNSPNFQSIIFDLAIFSFNFQVYNVTLMFLSLISDSEKYHHQIKFFINKCLEDDTIKKQNITNNLKIINNIFQTTSYSFIHPLPQVNQYKKQSFITKKIYNAIQYYQTKKYNQCISICHQIKQDLEVDFTSVYIQICYLQIYIAQSHFKLSQFDQSVYRYHCILQKLRQCYDFNFLFPVCYLGLVQNYLKLKKFSESLYFAEKALKYLNKQYNKNWKFLDGNKINLKIRRINLDMIWFNFEQFEFMVDIQQILKKDRIQNYWSEVYIKKNGPEKQLLNKKKLIIIQDQCEINNKFEYKVRQIKEKKQLTDIFNQFYVNFIFSRIIIKNQIFICFQLNQIY